LAPASAAPASQPASQLPPLLPLAPEPPLTASQPLPPASGQWELPHWQGTISPNGQQDKAGVGTAKKLSPNKQEQAEMGD